MMEDETRQLLIGLFRELKKDITDVKMDISAVTAGQEELKTELKTDIGAVTAGQEELKNDMKSDISALETKINAGQEELRQEIKAFQERIRNIEAGQAAFEERVTCTVDTQLKNVSSMVEQQTRNLGEDLSKNIEATESGCTARPGPEECHQSCSRHGKARTRSSTGSTMSSTEFSGTPGRE
jgi:predicted nuclease with TOPRIM domain